MEPSSATNPKQVSTERKRSLSVLRDLPVPKGRAGRSKLSPGEELPRAGKHFQCCRMLSVILTDFTSLKIKLEDREEKGKKSRLKSERDQHEKHDRVFTWWQETVDGLL